MLALYLVGSVIYFNFAVFMMSRKFFKELGSGRTKKEFLVKVLPPMLVHYISLHAIISLTFSYRYMGEEYRWGVTVWGLFSYFMTFFWVLHDKSDLVGKMFKSNYLKILITLFGAFIALYSSLMVGSYIERITGLPVSIFGSLETVLIVVMSLFWWLFLLAGSFFIFGILFALKTSRSPDDGSYRDEAYLGFFLVGPVIIVAAGILVVSNNLSPPNIARHIAKHVYHSNMKVSNDEKLEGGEPWCNNLPVDAQIVFLLGGGVSVAHQVDGIYSFVVQPCERSQEEIEF